MPPSSGTTAGVNPFASIDWRRIVVGNWVGAGLTAGVAFGIAMIVAALVAFLGADPLDVKSAIGLTAILTGETFGADTLSKQGGATLSVGQYPLLGTFLALGAAALVFRRACAAYPDIRAALGDALRASLVLSLLLTALSILVKIVEPDLRGYGNDQDDSSITSLADFAALAGIGAGNGKQHTSIVGAIFVGFLLLLTVLVAVCFMRRDWAAGTWRKVSDWVSAPLAGVVALLAALVAAGVVYVVAMLIGEGDTRDVGSVTGLVASLPALGMRVLGLGVGSKWGASYHYKNQDESSMTRLSGFADAHGGLFWICIPLALALAAWGVWVVIRRGHDRGTAPRDVLVYLGLLVVATPLLAHLSNFNFAYGLRKDRVTFFIGIDAVQTTLLFVLASAVIGALLLLLTGNLNLAAMKARAGTLQRNPASGPHPGPTTPPPSWAPPPATHVPPESPPSADS